MARTLAGPFRSANPVANGVIFNKKAWFGGYTVANGSGAPVTVTFYDNPVDDGSNLIETCVVPAGATQAIYPNVDTLSGLSVRSTAYTTVGIGVRWAPF